MLKKFLVLLMALSLAALGGCGDSGGETDCVDNDGDGYGVGADCTGTDCNDNDNACWTGACCSTNDCVDNDGDGYGTGADCFGPDCNDSDNSCWTGTCCGGTDCVDNDGDGYGTGADCLGTDCDDNDNACWAGACCTGGDCADGDGDGYGLGSDCLGLDCNDDDDQCWEGDCCPGSCLDQDGDGYGQGDGCQGPDCDDNNDQCWLDGDACCPTYCTDNDGDGYGVGQDCLGTDCNDDDVNCWEGACCPTDLDLTGVWAQRFCQNEEYDTMLGTESGTRVVLGRIQLDHTGNTITEVSEACGVLIPQMGSIQVTFPDALVSSIPDIHTTRTLATNSVGDPYENSDAPLIQLIAWNPDGDPETEALPTETDDPRIYDQDGDGNVGATANVYVDMLGGIECDIYVVARTVIRVAGTIVSPTEISGDASSVSADQVTLEATENICNLGAEITQMAGSTFKKVKLSDPNMTCQDIVDNMDTIFGGPCPSFP